MKNFYRFIAVALAVTVVAVAFVPGVADWGTGSNNLLSAPIQ